MDAPALPPENGREAGVGPNHARADHSMSLPAAVETATASAAPVTRAASPPPAPAGPRAPRRELWLDLPPEYPGFKVRLWVNYPARYMTVVQNGGQPDTLARLRELEDADGAEAAEKRAALQEQALAESRAMLGQIVLEHNGWCDADGTPYPPPTSPDFWEDISTELAAAILALLQAETMKLPSSLMKTRRR